MPKFNGEFVAWGYVAGRALHPGFRLEDNDGWFELTTTIPSLA